MSHFWAGGIGTLGHERETDRFGTVRTFIADGVLIKVVNLILFDPHELGAFRTSAYLCPYHGGTLDRTLEEPAAQSGDPASRDA